MTREAKENSRLLPAVSLSGRTSNAIAAQRQNAVTSPNASHDTKNSQSSTEPVLQSAQNVQQANVVVSDGPLSGLTEQLENILSGHPTGSVDTLQSTTTCTKPSLTTQVNRADSERHNASTLARIERPAADVKNTVSSTSKQGSAAVVTDAVCHMSLSTPFTMEDDLDSLLNLPPSTNLRDITPRITSSLTAGRTRHIISTKLCHCTLLFFTKYKIHEMQTIKNQHKRYNAVSKLCCVERYWM
jgi:hypothetical protein